MTEMENCSLPISPYDVMIIPENVSPFDTMAFCDLTGVSKKVDLQPKKARRYSKRLPSVVVNQISKETYAKLQEQMWKFKGFFHSKEIFTGIPH